MRRQLVRSTFLAVAIAVLLTGLPTAVLGTWLGAQRPDLLVGWMAQAPAARGWQVVLGLLLQAALVVALTVLVAASQSRRVAEPMIELAEAPNGSAPASRVFSPCARGSPRWTGSPTSSRAAPSR